MDLVIITHCYAVEHEAYAGALRLQMGSIACESARSGLGVRLYVACDPDDVAVARVIDWGRKWYPDLLQVYYQPRQALWRRCIARNHIARSIAGEVNRHGLLWFADCDHVCGKGSLTGMFEAYAKAQEQAKEELSLVWPRHTLISPSHAAGESLCLRAAGAEVESDASELAALLEGSNFERKTNKVAIGGIQIVPPFVIKEGGYIHALHRFHQPRTDGKPFGDFKDDVRFRQQCHRLGVGKSLDFGPVFRVRHLNRQPVSPEASGNFASRVGKWEGGKVGENL